VAGARFVGRNAPVPTDGRGTALVPTDTSYASRMSTAGDDGDAGDAQGRNRHQRPLGWGAERSSVQIRPPRSIPVPRVPRPLDALR
jgi:hypothetical protein